MDTGKVIRISNPSKELMDFLKKAQSRKEESMDRICNKYTRLLND